MRLKEGVGPLISIQQHNNGNHGHHEDSSNLNHQNNARTNRAFDSTVYNVVDTNRLNLISALKHTNNSNTNRTNTNNSSHRTHQLVPSDEQHNQTVDVVNNTRWSYTDICTKNQQTTIEQHQHQQEITVDEADTKYNNQHQLFHDQQQYRKDLLQNINNNLASNIQIDESTTTHVPPLCQHVNNPQRNNLRGAANNHHINQRPPRRNVTSSSLCSAESSPDDSLLEYEEPHQSCSSVDTSPQDDEDRGFELSDSESLSDDGNLSGNLDHHHCHHPRRGIVNPNYPGFQHLAHTLEYSIKTHTSDTDFTDDDLDLDPVPSSQTVPTTILKTKLNIDENNINNNNNNNNNNEEIIEESEEFKIDSVNRLDSVENISKVFYDKPKFNIPLECETATVTEQYNIQTDENACANYIQKEHNHSIGNSVSIDNIIGNFGKEIEQELGRRLNATEKATIESKQNERAIEKLSTSPQKEPIALKYNIEPNDNEPLKTKTEPTVEKVEPKPETPVVITKKIPSPTKIKSDPVKETPIKMETLIPVIEAIPQGILQKPLIFHPVDNIKSKMADAFLSDTRDDIITNYTDKKVDKTKLDSNRMETQKMIIKVGATPKTNSEKHTIEKKCKEDLTKDEKEKDDTDSTSPSKKEKVEINYHSTTNVKPQTTIATVQRREASCRNRSDLMANRRSAPASTTHGSAATTGGGSNSDKKRNSPDIFGSFDVYNIETAMPYIDLDAIESHLKAAREEERRRRTDREEIRRRLAMGSESDEYYTPGDRPGRKPSLQARLQSGMNLQICFMNETVSDSDSPNSDNESTTITTPAVPSNTKHISRAPPYHNKSSSLSSRTRQSKSQSFTNGQRPHSLALNNQNQPQQPQPLQPQQPQLQPLSEPVTEADFFARQARLQIEARMALAQAKEMAHMQMEVERQRQKQSPITEMVRSSLEKVGIQFPEERRRVSRQILTEMNVAQLQVIVNDLHSQIENLNEGLVKYLMDRDDLHMEQDSMLVDIEDLTRYLGAKEQSVKEQKLMTTPQQQINNHIPAPSPLVAISSSVKPRLHRIASLVKK